ncbi:hypothetical protein [Sodalis sp. (in: enterobacteria)]|uniref:hypothetical protein n=1 Tax=Sodalis sp. (in: enterobacteria) TaxID=1898979 RepID=UPI003F363C76
MISWTAAAATLVFRSPFLFLLAGVLMLADSRVVAPGVSDVAHVNDHNEQVEQVEQVEQAKDPCCWLILFIHQEFIASETLEDVPGLFDGRRSTILSGEFFIRRA